MIPHLTIHSVQGRIGVQTKPAQLEMNSSLAQLSIQQPRAELNIKTVPSRLKIDQTKAWNNLNLKSPFVRTQEAASSGHQAAMEGIARRAQQGEELMKIENPGNPIISQAIENSESRGSYDTGHTPPFEAVKIQFKPADVNIQWQPHYPKMNSASSQLKMNYHPGNVNVYMQQYPSVSIEVAGSIVDSRA